MTGTQSLLVILSSLLGMAISTSAQTIVIDGTTPTTLTTGSSCSGDCTVAGGSRAGGNLFHSFTNFGVDPGATVTFIDPGVQNIVTRVTGNSRSIIDGLLEVNGGNANLFLLNPNGITFGDGASLKLGGSFFASTASGLQFQDGAFSLTDSSAAESLLTVNVPIGLQMGIDSGPITVRGTGNNLFINPNLSIEDFLASPNLQVQQGTLGLLGRDVILDGAVLSAPGGRIEIGSVSEGLVGLIPTAEGFRLDYSDVNTFGDVSLDNAALIEVSNDSAGNVQLRGQEISLNNGSAVIANTRGDGSGGLIQIDADSLSLSGTASFAPGFIPPEFADLVAMPSGVFASVTSGASGTGSQINLNVGNLSLDGGAQIAASTFGTGDAGTLNVFAENITASGGRPAGPSGLFTTVAAASNGGPIGAATGNGGNLNLTTRVLTLREGGQISAGTFGFGDAGNVTVNSELTQVVGSFGVPGAGGPSSLRSASERPWAGAGGTLTIDTNQLVVADGGQIVTGTLSTSDAGNLIVRAEQVELSGSDAFGRSGLLSNAVDFRASGNDGNGGSIIVEANELRVLNGATISVSNTPSGANPILTPGQGSAGDITITAQRILLDNDSSLTADTLNGDRANISVAARTLTLRNSRITTNATGTATGGNIYLETGALSLLDSSTISANSTFSFGGRVIVNTEILVQSPDSQITASSALGPEFDGVVEINNPNPPPNEAQQQANSPTATKQIIATCEQITENELVVTGQGGIPADPTQTLVGQGIWADIRALEVDRAATSQRTEVINRESSSQPLDEASGMVRNDQGQLMLVAARGEGSDPAFAFERSTSVCN